jgi:lysophospholipase L1-like esterase
MSPLPGGSNPEPDAEVGPARIRQMAHFDPKVAQTKRLMAHPVRRGPLGALDRALAGLRPKASLLDEDEVAAPATLPARLVAGRRGRVIAGLAALLVVAAVVGSVVLPGSGAAHPSASATASLAANVVSPDPSESASPSPSASPSAVASPSDSPGPSASPSATPVKTPAKPYSFVALGDSLTAWPEGDPWPTRLDAEDARLRLAHNAGIPGNLTSEMLARLNKDVFAYNPSVLFILGGTNDLGRNVSSATAIANLKSIIIAAKAKKIRVYLITLPPESPPGSVKGINSFNASLLNLANAFRVVLINIHDVLSTSTGVYQSKYTTDGIHFTSLGAQVVANTIYARVHRLGY